MATKFDVSDVNLDVELENKADDCKFYIKLSTRPRAGHLFTIPVVVL